MSYDVVTVGVICADVMVKPVDGLPARGTLGLVPQLEMHLGGLAGVTAAVVCQLGGAAAFVGSLGEDGFGDYLLASLAKAGVDTRHVRRRGDARSSATVVCIASDGERTFMHHMGTNATVTEADLDYAAIQQAKVFHWGGPGITPKLEGAAMGEIMKKVKAMDVQTSMDTCYDGKGEWLPLIAPVLPHLDIVFSSLEEARCYTGKHTPEDIADFYASYGVKTVVIKLGVDGLYLKSCDEAFYLAAHAVNVIDTTGAGDAACGGFLYGHVRGWDLRACGRLANAVGGLTVQHMGGAEAIVSLEETLKFMETAATYSPAAAI
jgi:sugar/nucleoside kinase (ribokinase family)